MAKSQSNKCYFGCKDEGPIHRFPGWQDLKADRFNKWKSVLDLKTQSKGNVYIYNNIRLCFRHFEAKYHLPSNRLTLNSVPTLNIVQRSVSPLPSISGKQEISNITIGKCDLEVCIDSLESAVNAVQGGANELEVCSSLVEGGLTPSPGLVTEILKLVKHLRNYEESSQNEGLRVPRINIMIRCRGGSDFCYSEHEMDTMLADIRHYKTMDVDSFVFGALNPSQEIDIVKCSRIISEAHPKPVTFHRAFDISSNPDNAIKILIQLGFKRLLTSGQRLSAADNEAIQLIKELQYNYGDKIQIMPGAGVTTENVRQFIELGCQIVHSSCKVERKPVLVQNDLAMGACSMYVTSEVVVRSMVKILNEGIEIE